MTNISELSPDTIRDLYGERLHSITEPDRRIYFKESTHVYVDIDTGETLTSATTYIKKYKEPFDPEKIAKKCEDQYNWGIKYKEILGIWNATGEIASSFGTSLHLALELWCRNKALGYKVMENTNRKENPALPKHPLLRSIILGFEEIDNYQNDYEVIPEAFISCGSFCGLVDLLYVNRVSKEVRIGDYKINVSPFAKGKQKYLGKFSHLVSNKVSGYQLQMSFYSAMLKEAGWNVLGLTAYIYEHEWTKVDMDVLDNVIDLPKENWKVKLDKEKTDPKINIVNMKKFKGESIPCYRGHVLGNPFPMKHEKDRDKVCEQFKEHLHTKLYVDKDKAYRDAIEDIVLKVRNGEEVNLSCYCDPKRCHTESIRDEVLKLL